MAVRHGATFYIDEDNFVVFDDDSRSESLAGDALELLVTKLGFASENNYLTVLHNEKEVIFERLEE